MKSIKGRPRDLAASVRQRLLNGAKERGEEFTFVLTRFALERLLFRLGQSRHAGQFVLKGAMLFPLWSGSPHRATKDMDLLGYGPPDRSRLVATFRELAAMDAEDGLSFRCCSSCPPGQADCGACVSLATDGNNWGACGKACVGGQTYQNGFCR